MRGSALLVAAFLMASCGGTIGTEGRPDSSTDTGTEEPGPDGGCLVDEDCEDGDPCTRDECDPGTGECEFILDDDGDGDGYDGIGCGGDDCDNEDPDVYPGAPEIPLDGIDQDCDTITDGPVVEPSDTQITDANGASLSDELTVAWTGSQYAMSWVDDRHGNDEIYFVRLTPLAEMIGSDTRITDDGGVSLDPSLAWTGSQFGLAWFDDRDGNEEIYFVRIDLEGNPIGSDVRITSDGGSSDEPSLVWADGEFGVSWVDDRDGNPEIYFKLIGAAGSISGSDVRITDSASSSDRPSLQWAGGEFGVCWEDERDGNDEIYFARISSSGDKIGSDVRITEADGFSTEPSLAWADSQYGVGWTDHRDGNDEIYFARISTDGEKIGSDVQISDDRQSDVEPFLSWTGSEFGLARTYWSGYSSIFFTPISADGSEVGADLLIPDGDAASSYQPALAWSGSEFGVGMMEYRDFDFNVFFNRVGFSE